MFYNEPNFATNKFKITNSWLGLLPVVCLGEALLRIGAGLSSMSCLLRFIISRTIHYTLESSLVLTVNIHVDHL